MEDSQEKSEVPKNLRTYQSDVEGILKGGEGSLVKIAVAENEKRFREGFVATDVPEPTHSKFIIITSIVLVIVGLGAVVTLYLLKGGKETTTNTATTIAPIILADSEKNISLSGLDRDKIIGTLVKEKQTLTATLSHIINLKLTDGTGETASQISAQNFLAKLNSQAPNELTRTLKDNFSFGLYALNNNRPFLILKTSYYQNAFAGMLSWEKNMKEDLGPIFIPPQPTVAPSTSADVLNKNMLFEDVVVKNRDARALRGSGGIIFLYSFPDKDTIVITTDADTLEAVSGKLLAGKLVR